MKTRPFIALLAGLCIQGSPALAQEFDPAVTTTSDDLQPAPTCFTLVSPSSSCLLVAPAVINPTAPAFDVVDLNGAWTDGGNNILYFRIYGEGNPVFVDMSLVNRPDGFGVFVDAKTMTVVFPDDRDYTGTLVTPTTIRWSNNTFWYKLPNAQ
ncbi:MAG TPA: hypothetical protein VNN80_07660 [Polyangiaceae bacterium]|jgi:hypothetical protein|nr:hypothetical protein [Polyangiaceae bacterium]